MNFLHKYLKSFVSEEEGQTLIEYALVLVLIVLLLAAVSPGAVKTAMNTVYTTIAAKLTAT